MKKLALLSLLLLTGCSVKFEVALDPQKDILYWLDDLMGKNSERESPCTQRDY
jgi:uncharacterized protein YcfL